MSALRLETGPYTKRITERIAALQALRFPARLAEGDDALWGDDPARRKVARERLGWMRSPATMRERASEFASFAQAAAAEGFSHVTLLGMGGSSLAPEVFTRVFGTRPGRLSLSVLDDTSPAAVRIALADYDPRRTLVVVSSMSGGTVEVTSFERAFFARAQATLGERAGRSFVAITDPGTVLETHAREHGYRQVFRNPADIGGRYSALSCFGLVPAALLGVDAGALCDAALAEASAFASDGGDALRLGAALGELALAGRDKLTLVMGAGFGALGAWIEQLVAESTGKEGRGILPVDGEALAAPGAYEADRVFVGVGLRNLPDSVMRALDALVAAGHPVLRWNRDTVDELGGEFLRWEIATAVAGHVIGVNPFDEPNVAEAKAATKAVLDQVTIGGRVDAGEPLARDGALALNAPAGTLAGGDARAWAQAFLDLLRPGNYAAVLAYVRRTDARHATLERLRLAMRAGARVATTLGYGPRYLHSTGQLHKGGPPAGVFLEITCDDGDEPIPGGEWGFGVLHAAQAAGDYAVLVKHGLRVMRVHVSGELDDGLEALASAFEAAVSARA